VRRVFPVAARIRPVGTGWDSDAYEVDGEWIVRFPRRPEVAQWLRKEAALLPELAPALSVRAPRFEHVSLDEPVYLAHRKLAGRPLEPHTATRAVGVRLGRFLAELHGFDVERARRLGVPEPAWAAAQAAFAAALRARVFPLLSTDERSRAERMLEGFLALGFEFRSALVHGDLGAEHVLVDEAGELAVIDWSDARIGDPALDFAWLLHGLGREFADALAAAYGRSLDAAFRLRALAYHRLGPWHEVLYGLDHARDDLVASGLAGIRARLPA
jgi:aminoglycoside phosphotransferase (APT) family kinase protein